MSAPTVGGDGSPAGGQAVTLTVQPGTLLSGSSGNDYLVVNRGSRINAQSAPPASRSSSPPAPIARRHGVTDSSQGLWGGVILLGRAPISDCNAAVPGGSADCQQVIEGTTSSLYGGDSAERQ